MISPAPDPDEYTNQKAFEDLMKTGYYFPGRPIVRKIQKIQFSSNERQCNKDYKQSGKFGAGTLIFWCAQHRRCLGKNILLKQIRVCYIKKC